MAAEAIHEIHLRFTTVRAVGLATMVLLFVCTHCPAQFTPSTGPGSTNLIPQAQLIQPEELVHLLQATGTGKPLLLQVGSHLLFDEAHITGSVYAGAGSQPTGLQQLQSTVASFSKKKFIVSTAAVVRGTAAPTLALHSSKCATWVSAT